MLLARTGERGWGKKAAAKRVKNIFPTFVRFSLKQPSPRVRHPLFNTIPVRFIYFFFFCVVVYKKKKKRKERRGKKNVQISVEHTRGGESFLIFPRILCRSY